MPEQSLIIAGVYGVLSAVSLCLGKGLQKYGVDVIVHPKTMLRRDNLFKLFVWCLGTSGMVASALLLFTACAYGPITIIAALSGTGLIALALFSTWVLKERIGRSEIAGIILIVAGTALAGYFEKWPGVANVSLAAAPARPFNATTTVLFSLGVVALSLGMAAYSLKNHYRFFGPIFGSISGFCGGISIFYQKGTMIYCRCDAIFADIPAVLRNPFFYPFVITGLLDFLVTQYALTRSKAVTVVPCYQSFYIALPIGGGILAYYESFNVLQLAGVALLLWGVVLVSRYVARE
jgi:uncharacterized membrane protein